MNIGKSTPAPARKRATIEWGEIQQRQEAVRAAIELATLPDMNETRHILKLRAEALSRSNEPDASIDGHIEVVEFILAQEHYAVESQYVRDVYPLEQLTPVPCTPAFVLGIVNLRSEILSLIDIKKFFDLPENGITDLNKVIVLEAGNMRFGILADVTVGVHHIAMADIQPSLPTLTGIREEYLKGVTPGRTVILDAEKLLTDERIVVQEQVS